MTYQQAVDYLLGQLPMYQRIGPVAYKANLDNTIALSHHLGNPEHAFSSIHIAGTNGKGSVAHMLASVLQEAGYKTGLATSPHIKDYRERIKINGHCISKKGVADFVSKNLDFFEPLQASFFEISIAMTFKYFSDEQVDIAVVETGLGGRLDSTNILMPEISVITNIGLDHTALLGDTLEKIASEKGGIMKAGTPVIIGRRQDALFPIFAEKAKTFHAPIIIADELFSLSGSNHVDLGGHFIQEFTIIGKDGHKACYQCDLTGMYQRENVLTALAAISVLNDRGRFVVPDEAIRQGLRRVVANTGIIGRWQQIGKQPSIICDTAHNVDGIRMMVSQLVKQSYSSLRMVIGMVDDKDVGAMLSLFPRNALYYFCRPDVPRGLDVNKLMAAAQTIGMEGKGFESVADALKHAKEEASADDLIFVGGSTFVVAEVV